MKRIPVVSNSIKEIGYDEKSQHMEILFHNGRLYKYKAFPHRLYRRLLNAPSHGNFFHTEIRPSYQGIEVDPGAEARAKEEETG